MAGYLGIPRSDPHGATGSTSKTSPSRPLARTPFTIGYFARVAPEKGLHNLAEAYRILRQERGLPKSRLIAAGYMGADQRSYLEGSSGGGVVGLADEFEIRHGRSRHEAARFLASLDVLAVPSGYHEPKGLYLLEAMATGVPVVQPNHGAFPEMIGRTGGGLLSKSEQPADVADALMTIWRSGAGGDPRRRAEGFARTTPWLA